MNLKAIIFLAYTVSPMMVGQLLEGKDYLLQTDVVNVLAET
jgi:hypothetical protein